MRRDWRDDALCREIGADLFFPGQGGGVEARKACAMCTVRAECLEDALNAPGDEDTEGIRAGIGPRTRAKLRAQRKKTAA